MSSGAFKNYKWNKEELRCLRRLIFSIFPKRLNAPNTWNCDDDWWHYDNNDDDEEEENDDYDDDNDDYRIKSKFEM
jgi:hypothetical protein